MSGNVKVYVRFIIFFQISFWFFFLLTVMLDTSISCFLSAFAGGGGSNVSSVFWGWGMRGNMPYRTIKMEPVDVQLVTYIDYGIEHNDKDLKFKGSDHAKEY